jgi:cold shock CspA family protein
MPAATAVTSGAPLETRCGVMLRIRNGFGFIAQDCGDEDMFVMPASCKVFGGIFPPLATRVSYNVVVDGKTGRPRAENVRPEVLVGNTTTERSASANRKGFRSGVVARKKDNSFGFIQQDNGEEDMFVMPNACDAFGGSLPTVGVRVLYTVVRDMKTRKPRAENVKPETEHIDTNMEKHQSMPTLLLSSNTILRDTSHRQRSKTQLDEVATKPMLSDARPWRQPDARIELSEKSIGSPSSSAAETDVGAESVCSPTASGALERVTFLNPRRCSQRDEDPMLAAGSDTQMVTAFETTHRPRLSERSRPEQLKRTVQSLLNKLCPENIQTVCARITREAEIHNAEELELVICTVVEKALIEAHYSETYADLVYHLAATLPEFQFSVTAKPVTVKSILLNVCQDEYDAMPTRFQPGSKPVRVDICCDWSKLKARLLANMRFIGNLFVRQLVSIKLILAILADLLRMQDHNAPDEHVIECVCQLLLSIGYTLEAMPAGKAFLSQVSMRLEELKEQNTCMYSKRIKFCIQDLLEIRAAGWAKKTFKGLAQTKMEIKQKQEEDMKVTGTRMERADTLIAGGRPACLSEDSEFVSQKTHALRMPA